MYNGPQLSLSDRKAVRVTGHPSQARRLLARPGRRTTVGAAGAALILLSLNAVSGCGAADPPQAPSTPAATEAPSPSDPAGPPPTETAVSPEQAALAAYRGMWKAYVDASQDPDPTRPDLTRYAADDALQVLVEGLETMARNGLASRGDVVLNPQVSSLEPADDPTSAEITDCVDTSGTELYRLSGEPYEGSPGGPRRADATVEDTGNDGWKVTGFALYEVGSCTH